MRIIKINEIEKFKKETQPLVDMAIKEYNKSFNKNEKLIEKRNNMLPKYHRNFIKLKGQEKCPLQYLVPKGVKIKNIYEISSYSSDFEQNYKTADLSKYPKLENGKEYILTNHYIEMKFNHNYSVCLIIEY